MRRYRVGQTVEILQSRFGNDGWVGTATVVRVDTEDLLVEIGNTEVWFHFDRIAVPS